MFHCWRKMYTFVSSNVDLEWRFLCEIGCATFVFADESSSQMFSHVSKHVSSCTELFGAYVAYAAGIGCCIALRFGGCWVRVWFRFDWHLIFPHQLFHFRFRANFRSWSLLDRNINFWLVIHVWTSLHWIVVRQPVWIWWLWRFICWLLMKKCSCIRQNCYSTTMTNRPHLKIDQNIFIHWLQGLIFVNNFTKIHENIHRNRWIFH